MNCASYTPDQSAALAAGVKMIVKAVYNAAQAKGDLQTARDVLMSEAFRNPSCAQVDAAWAMATPWAHDPLVNSAWHAFGALVSNLKPAKPPIAGIFAAAGMIAVATAMMIAPTRMRG